METTTIKIEGMSCAHCRRAVETALARLPGVSKVEVDLERGQARVTHQPGRPGPEALKRAVREAGYDCP